MMRNPLFALRRACLATAVFCLAPSLTSYIASPVAAQTSTSGSGSTSGTPRPPATLPPPASTTPGTPAVAPSAPSSVRPASIGDVVQAEDVISVLVVNHPEMSLESIVVPASGTIQVPLGGAVKIAGKTTTQAAADVAKALRGQLRNPRVTVIIRASRQPQIFVLGLVSRPGVYDLPRGGGVAEALALAGGGSPRAALTQATIKRADGTVVPVDLLKAASQPQLNITLQPGDVLTVPESQARIIIRGAVARPGVYDIADGTTVKVSDALSLAGGAAPRASLSRAQLTRADGTIIPVDLFKAIALGDPAANLDMASGDALNIPIGVGITVLGAVQKPGVLTIEGPGMTIAEALAQSGGLNVPTAQARISLSRTGEDGKTQISTIDPVQLLNLRDPEQNVRLQDGDLISVASREAQTVFISGEVKTPGAYEIRDGDSVPELIIRAGGATPLAALTRISVVRRDGASQMVDVSSPLIEGGGRSPDMALQQGDFVVVPENKSTVLVLGSVGQPGRKIIPEKGQLTLGDALAAAGGSQNRARVTKILLLRQDASAPKGVSQQTVSIDGNKNGQLALNQPLLPGTLVYVPEAKEPNRGLLSILNPLTTLALLRRN